MKRQVNKYIDFVYTIQDINSVSCPYIVEIFFESSHIKMYPFSKKKKGLLGNGSSKYLSQLKSYTRVIEIKNKTT